MPTSADLKSGDSLFFTTPSEFQRTPTPTNWPSPEWEWLRTLNGVLHEVHTIKFRNHRFDARNNLCEWLNTCKNAPETVLRIRKIEVLSLNWAKSRTKAQKSSKDDFIREIWWPVRESGRSAPYLGDSRISRETWRVCDSNPQFPRSLLVTPGIMILIWRGHTKNKKEMLASLQSCC